MSVRPTLRLLALLGILLQAWAVEDGPLSLSGTWSFRLDQDKAGVDGRWFDRDFADTIPLPGTTDEVRKGERNDKQEYGRLTRRFTWTGWAWYQLHSDTLHVPPVSGAGCCPATVDRYRCPRPTCRPR